tara:strand:- start:232 stop:450 length:219 start_codon:yes stop_codon:yes gene_type:complete
MPSTHDRLQIMTTNEMLMNNTNDLQERLIISNKKILELIDKVKELDKKLVGVNYSLGGAEIYLNDIRELLND